MFEYAFYLSLRHKHPYSIYAFDTYASEIEHYDYELDRIFHIDSHKERRRLSILRKLERHNFLNFTEIREDNAITYCPEVYSNLWQPHLFKGYWQSEKYFYEIENRVRRAFTFKTEMLSERTKSLARDLALSRNAISVHIRRGDYVHINDTQTFGLEYYNRGIRLLRDEYGGGCIVIFRTIANGPGKTCITTTRYSLIGIKGWNHGRICT